LVLDFSREGRIGGTKELILKLGIRDGYKGHAGGVMIVLFSGVYAQNR
jgi:hypothetical protein